MTPEENCSAVVDVETTAKCYFTLAAGSRDAVRHLFRDRLARVRLVSIFVGDNGSGFGAGHDFEARIKIDHG